MASIRDSASYISNVKNVSFKPNEEITEKYFVSHLLYSHKSKIHPIYLSIHENVSGNRYNDGFGTQLLFLL